MHLVQQVLLSECGDWLGDARHVYPFVVDLLGQVPVEALASEAQGADPGDEFDDGVHGAQVGHDAARRHPEHNQQQVVQSDVAVIIDGDTEEVALAAEDRRAEEAV